MIVLKCTEEKNSLKTVITYLKIIISIKPSEMPCIISMPLNFKRGKFNLILEITKYNVLL